MSNETLTADNTDLQVTEAKLIDWSACASGKNWFLEKFPQGGMFGDVYRALLDDRRYDDGNWLVEKVFSQLDAKTKAEQLVSIAGADKAKIERQVKECGGKKEESATTGYLANAATTGERANAATTGEGANAATTGYRAYAATTGDRANAATTGDRANAVTTGYLANAVTTGDLANAATTGYRANAATTGEHAVSAALGIEGKAKAGFGGAIVLCHRNNSGELIHIRASKVGENGVKADTWYSLDASGEFVEVDHD